MTQDTTASSGPAIVLVRPQLGQNVGMAARAMLNCGLSDLRLVAPRDAWPNPDAQAAAVGADRVVDAAGVYDDAQAAVARCHRVYATTARPRDQVKPVVTPRQAAAELRAAEANGERVAVLFGPERTGLENDEVALADAAIYVPLNPGFTSLNLAQAVLLVAYEWWIAADATAPRRLAINTGAGVPAERAELDGFLERLLAALDSQNFFTLPEKRAQVARNIRNIFTRAGVTQGELDTLHGVLSALIKMPKQPRKPRK